MSSRLKKLLLFVALVIGLALLFIGGLAPELGLLVDENGAFLPALFGFRRRFFVLAGLPIAIVSLWLLRHSLLADLKGTSRRLTSAISAAFASILRLARALSSSLLALPGKLHAATPPRVRSALLTILTGLAIILTFPHYGISFWKTDTALYVRYFLFPEELTNAIPTFVNTAILNSPTFHVEALRALLDIGFKPNLTAHTWLFMYIASILNALCVGLAAYLIARVLGAGRAFALLAVLICSSTFVSLNTRYITLATATFTSPGYLSTTAICIFILAMALLIRGSFIPAVSLSTLAAYVHPVTGGLALALVIGGQLFATFLSSKDSAEYRRTIIAAAGAALFLVPIALRYLARSSSITLDTDTFFAYIWHRSSNPMPLRDGLAVIIATILLVTLCGLLLKSFWTTFRPQTRLTFAFALAFLLAALLTQIFVGEVLRSPSLVAIVLHRPLPALSVLFAALAAAAFSRAAAENPTGRWIPALLILLFPLGGLFDGLTHWLNVPVEIGAPRTDLNGPFTTYAAAALLTTLLLLGRKNIRQPAYRPWLIWGALLLAIAIVSSFIGSSLNGRMFCPGSPQTCQTGAFLQQLDTAELIRLGGWSILWLALQLPPIRNRIQRYSALHKSLPLAILAVTFIFFAGFPHTQWFTARPRPNDNGPFNQNVQTLLRAIPEEAVYYPQIEHDELGTLRRAYINWSLDWYTFYGPGQTEHLLELLASMDLYVDHRSATLPYCDNGKWLFIFRCHAYASGGIEATLETDAWRVHLDEMQALEPALTHALIHTDDVRPNDHVILELGRFTIIDIARTIPVQSP